MKRNGGKKPENIRAQEMAKNHRYFSQTDSI